MRRPAFRSYTISFITVFASLFLITHSTSANALQFEESLYLRGHADNPVDWHAWNSESLAEAKKAGKPILISIGYSSCHWCHVMEEESFMDEEVAALMNKHFFCIKIDKEELPEVDHYYMNAVQRMTGSGGWPLNVICLPDGRPFFGGTYFPPKRMGSRPSWSETLERVAESFENDKANLENLSNRLNDVVIQQLSGTDRYSDNESISFDDYTETLVSRFDLKNGGFARSPKFPPFVALDYLIAAREHFSTVPELQKRIDTAVISTLDAMANGGLQDHLRGGFFRYSVTRDWSVPHFEKMLYDNAGFIRLYTHAWQTYKNPRYKEVAMKTIDWLFREMALEGGGFASSLNADSEGEEGLFYLWTLKELQPLLGDSQNAFRESFFLNSIEEGLYHFSTKNGVNSRNLEINQILEELFKEQEKRVRPSRDDKLLTSWNALVIDAIAEAGWIFEDDQLLERACAELDYFWNEAWSDEDGLSHLHYKGSQKSLPGYLDDYVYLTRTMLSIAGTGDVVRPGISKTLLPRIDQLKTEIKKRFSGPEIGYYYAPSENDFPVRFQKWFDHQTPSAMSLWAELLVQFQPLFIDSTIHDKLAALAEHQIAISRRSAEAAPYAMRAHLLNLHGQALVKVSFVKDIAPIQKLINKHLSFRVPVMLDSENGPKSGYQLCIGQTCLPDEPDPEIVVRKILEELN